MSNAAAEVRLWQTIFQVPQWTIQIEERENLTHPVTGGPAVGLCDREPESRTALILIDPAQSRLEWVKTICHEVFHCAFPPGEFTREEEENIVWPVTEALGWLRVYAPDLLEQFAATLPWHSKAGLARAAQSVRKPGGIQQLAARVRARAGDKRTMTPEEIKAMIEAIKGGDGAKALELLEAQLAAALANNTPAPASEPPKPPEAAAAVEEAPPSSRGAGYAAKDGPAPGTPAEPPKEPSMGMSKQPPEVAKAKVEEEANAKAARALARSIPNLTADQRKFAETNLKTIEAVESYARSLAAPKPDAAPAARMGLDAAPGKDGKTASVRARAAAVPTDDVVRETRNYAAPDADTNGIELDVPGHFIVLDPAKRHAERVAARTSRRAPPAQKGAA